MADDGTLPARRSSQEEVEAFLRQVAAVPRPATGRRGRLVFAMDATASRQPTWDQACRIQGEMFEATAALGGLDIQLVYYRGFGECRAGRWVGDADSLLGLMGKVSCVAGRTQIGRVLAHVLGETRRDRVNALVFVGDAMEEEIDELAHRAGELGLLGVPAFIFHERGDPVARHAFQTIARLTGGAYCPFDASSARQLRDLLAAVAVFAAGGRTALEDFGRTRGETVRLLTSQLGRGPGGG
ncbi:hypothetical protein [Azospirillum thermophilum]|uniref:VWA domain-containing protein n=1 Tax=Azospirillum thermophilum TaxID=2202148 RepID=A0A2S2CL74_9PROT|nr:hypothetical protein [Azospirillum thermophilum]AWK85265.1 hypothetical protein DEW08_02890 [Azospirillum thermophilum]